MKIKTKLILGLSIIPVLIFLLMGIGWFQSYSLKGMSDSLQDHYESAYLANQIHKKVKNQAIRLRNLLLYQDEPSIRQERIDLQAEKDSIMQDIASLESLVSTEEQRSLVQELNKTNQKFNAYQENFLQYLSEGNSRQAILLMHSNSQPIQDEFFQIIQASSDAFEKDMKSSLDQIPQDYQRQIIVGSLLSLIGTLLVTGFLFRSIWRIARRLNKVSGVMISVANGSSDLKTRVEVTSHDEIDDVAYSFNRMVESLEEQMEREQNQHWIKSNIAEITTSLSGTHDLESVSRTFLSQVAPLMGACHAVFYMKEADEAKFKLLASYAFKERKHLSTEFGLGEGLVGQAAYEKSPIILSQVPSDYIRVQSGLGEAPPLNLYVLPICFEGEVKAVVEIASFEPFSLTQQSFIEELIDSVGIILDSVMGRIQLAKLLQESQALMEEIQAQSEELQSQQEELRAINEELEEQTQSLRQSEEKLQMQQEELEQTNADLEEKANRLEEQNHRFEAKNKEVEKARAELEEKARQLTLSSKYKSEFLANMSHELRTPLNSLLILSKLLSDNHERNLTDKQIEYARTIFSSGTDLLTLINDILDLAKIESGKMTINSSQVMIRDLAEFVEQSFRPVANENRIRFEIVWKEGLPEFIYSDEQRLQQVLKNLLSNAFKFTHKGSVTLEISKKTDSMLAFSVIDTGIGISKEKQELIFQAFQQADGTTSRKYGGTGLGLSISRELAALLGGSITVESEEGKGSIFTFLVGDYQRAEQGKDHPATIEKQESKQDPIPAEPIHVKVNQPSPVDTNSYIKRLLIVDDDVRQRNSLMELIGNKDVIIKAVSSGKEAIEELKVSPFDCIILDLGLSDTTGFDLLETLKTTGEHDHLKVIIYTGRELTSKEEMYLKKHAHTIIIKDAQSPQRLQEELDLFLKASHEIINEQKTDSIQSPTGLEGKKILLVDDDVRNVYALSSILELYGMEITFAEDGKEALEWLSEGSSFDLVIMDIMMPEMDGYEAIGKIREIPRYRDLPIIALTAKAMKEDREKCMEVGASDYIMKPVDPDQLISLIRVWLHPKVRS